MERSDEEAGVEAHRFDAIAAMEPTVERSDEDKLVVDIAGDFNAAMEPTVERSDEPKSPAGMAVTSVTAAMEPTVERSDEGSAFLGRLSWDDARPCERHGNRRLKSLTFVLSSSEKYGLTCVRATTGV